MKTITTDTKQKNILMVDSDKTLVLDLQDLIEKEEIQGKYGLNFIFAKDSKEAIKKLADSTIDLIVMEIVLPIVNGYYLLNLLKKNYPNTPVIIYTRLKNPQDLAKISSYEVDNIFLKELMKTEDLVEIISKKESTKEDIDQVVMELQSQIKALSSGETHKQNKLISCARCNLIVAPNSHFCNNCGQKVIKKAKKTLRSENPEKTPKKTDVSQTKTNKK